MGRISATGALLSVLCAFALQENTPFSDLLLWRRRHPPWSTSTASGPRWSTSTASGPRWSTSTASGPRWSTASGVLSCVDPVCGCVRRLLSQRRFRPGIHKVSVLIPYLLACFVSVVVATRD